MSNDKSDPQITVVLPTYRRPHLLPKTLESVLSQTYRHFLICVYDNASGDDTEEIVKSFMQRDKRISYFQQEKNIGASANFDFGLSKVNTPYFCFLSDDDLLLPDFFETALSKLHEYPEAGFFAGGTIFVDESLNYKNAYKNEWASKEYYKPIEALKPILEHGSFTNWSAILFRKEMVDVIGGLDSTLVTSDVDFLLRSLLHFSCVASHKIASIFRSHSGAISYQINPRKLFYEQQVAYGRAKKYLLSRHEDQSALLVKAIDDRYEKDLCRTILGLFARRNYQDAEECLEFLSKDGTKWKRIKLMAKLLQIVPLSGIAFSLLYKMARSLKRSIGKTVKMSSDEKDEMQHLISKT